MAHLIIDRRAVVAVGLGTMRCDAMRLTPNLYALFPSLFYIYTTQRYYDLLPWDRSQFN